MKKGDRFSHQLKSVVINNLPGAGGITTGHYMFDLYGCWHEVKQKNGHTFWMIGDCPINSKGYYIIK